MKSTLADIARSSKPTCTFTPTVPHVRRTAGGIIQWLPKAIIMQGALAISMAALFAKLIASPTFLGASPSQFHATAWCRLLGLVNREFPPDAFRLGISKPKAHFNYPDLRLPPKTAVNGDNPKQWQSLPWVFRSLEGTSSGRKDFRVFRLECSYRALVLDLTQVDMRRGVGDKIQAPEYGKALRPSSTGKRHLSTTPKESGAAKKLCSVCKHEKLLRNFEAARTSVDGLHSLCRACLATLRAKRSGRPLYHLGLSVEEAWEQARVCRGCGQRQEIRDICRNMRQPDGIHFKCRSCDTGYQKSRPERTPSTQPQECSICEVVKPAKEFYPSKKGFMGLYPCCKSCKLQKARRWAEKVKESTLYIPAATKRCSKCGKEKSPVLFYKRKLLTDGLDTYCKECRKKWHSQ